MQTEATPKYPVGLGEWIQVQVGPNTVAGTEEVVSDPHVGEAQKWQVVLVLLTLVQVQMVPTSVLGWRKLRWDRSTTMPHMPVSQ